MVAVCSVLRSESSRKGSHRQRSLSAWLCFASLQSLPLTAGNPGEPPPPRPWHLIDIPSVKCGSEKDSGHWELSFPIDDVPEHDRDKHWMFTFIRSFGDQTQLKMKVLDAAGSIVMQEEPFMLADLSHHWAAREESGPQDARRLGLRLPKWGSASSAAATASGSASMKDGLAIMGTTALLSYEDGAEEADYGITGVAVLPHRVELAVDQSLLSQAAQHNYSRSKTWRQTYSAHCEDVASNDTVDCEACYAHDPNQCKTWFAPMAMAIRDDVYISRFEPDDFQWPLKVMIGVIDGRAVETTRICDNSLLPKDKQDLFITLSRIFYESLEEERLKEVYHESGGMLWVLLAIVGCCICCGCVAGLAMVLHFFKQHSRGVREGYPDSEDELMQDNSFCGSIT